MQRYIIQTIYPVHIGHIVSYRYRQEKYGNFDISLSFRYRFNIGETTSMLSVFFYFFGNKSIVLWVFTFQVSRHHALLITNNNPAHRSSTMLGLKLQQIRANAHETHDSISLILYAGCLGLSPFSSIFQRKFTPSVRQA